MADESGEDGQVECCILDLTARSLDGKPAGSVAMVSDDCAFKKMPFWWMVRVFRKMSLGTQFSPEELLNLSDLMGIALPMKHRFTKAELSEPIGVGPFTLASRIAKEPNHA